MIKYLTVPTLKFCRGELSNKEIDKRVKFASKKQYSEWGNRAIERDYYTKRALNTQALMAGMQEYPYTMVISFLEDWERPRRGLYEKYPRGLRELLSKYSDNDIKYVLSILPFKYRNA